jgi:exonuclease VII small subunit
MNHTILALVIIALAQSAFAQPQQDEMKNAEIRKAESDVALTAAKLKLASSAMKNAEKACDTTPETGCKDLDKSIATFEEATANSEAAEQRLNNLRDKNTEAKQKPTMRLGEKFNKASSILKGRVAIPKSW